ncbi:MAG: SusF/SusE family outer membrane protein [Flavobacteriales bacterium]|nr:SusF/SusE family outer membrane protein [Flavobacteriales bacterium]
MRKLLVLVMVIIGMANLSAQQVGFLGSAVPNLVGNADVQMFPQAGGNYISPGYTLQVGTLKFRENDAIIWGGSSFPSGTAVKGSDTSILITEAGKYDLTFNLNSGAYSIVKEGSVVEPVPSIGIIGTAVNGAWTEDVDLNTVDDVVYSISGYQLSVGELKFREGDAWTKSWGASGTEGTAQEGSDTNFSITEAGKYDISFNRNTLAYSFTKEAAPATTVVIRGAGLFIDKTLTSTDGNVYTATGVVLGDGGFKFVINENAVETLWGGGTFPEATATLDGGDITATAGTYDVSYTKSTGAYKFTAQGTVHAAIGLIGNAIAGTEWASDVDMMTTDGVTYTLMGQALVVGEVKFRQDDAWVTNWGASATAGVAELNAQGNISITEAGTYNVTFNLTTLAYSFEKQGGTPTVTVELTGAGVGTAKSLASTDGDIYTATGVVLTDGAVQFTVTTDGAAAMWGGGTFPEATATKDGGDITATAGTYDVSYTKSTGAYKFTAQGTVHASIGLIGSSIAGTEWASDVDMMTTDGVTYTLMGQALVVGEVKFRQDDAWVTNWGASATAGVAELNAQGNISITEAGTYNVTFNLTTLAYSFEKQGGTPTVTVELTGAGVGTAKSLASTDGDIYTATGVVLTDGAVQFTVTTDGVAAMWGGGTFPEATATKDGGDIAATAGTYDVSYTKSTGAYKFTAQGTFASIGIIGSAVSDDLATQWTTDVDMTTTDGVTYTLASQNLLVGDLKFRQDNAWTTNWGGSGLVGSGVPDGDNIAIAEAGLYNITFNQTTLEYSIEVVTVGVSEFNSEVEVSFSNPVVSGQLELSSSADVELYDLSGRLVSTGSGSSIDVSGLNSGLYIIVINGSQTSKVLIK